MENEENIRSIYKRFLDNQCREEELSLLYRHFRTSNERELLALILAEIEKDEDRSAATFKEKIRLERIHGHIRSQIEEKENQEKQPILQPVEPLWKRYSTAATVLLFISLLAGYYLLNQQPRYHDKESVVYAAAKFPEGKVFLRLPDGKVIPLMGDKGGVRIYEDRVLYQDDTKIVDQLPKAKLELVVTNGEQYQARLPDGTDVWLNTSSRLTIHPHFMERDRMVELEGEAFFAVKTAADNSGYRPFTVQAGMQKIEVLGTQFNVSAYRNEELAKTTLLNGKVKVTAFGTNHSVLLKPNEEALIQAESLSIQPADTAKTLAWKNGYFKFNGDKIQEIMTKISRWYGVDVAYRGSVTTEEFVGAISIHENLAQVLEMLSLSGNIQFELTDKKVIVSSKGNG